MQTTKILEAKRLLSHLIDAIERGEEREIVITRKGRPAAKLVPIEQIRGGVRLGAAKGHFTVPDDINTNNHQITQLIYSGDTRCLY